MAYIAEPLELVVNLKLELGKGNGFKPALHYSLNRLQGPFCEDVKVWLQEREKGLSRTEQICRSPIRRQLLSLISIGLEGAPVLDSLSVLEDHIKDVCLEDVNAHLDRLPMLLSLPLVFCFLPAYIMLIVGPIFETLKISELTQ
ncbi:MAG: hypothetical protein AAF202_10195 [Pseudomonadota bacterium]